MKFKRLLTVLAAAAIAASMTTACGSEEQSESAGTDAAAVQGEATAAAADVADKLCSDNEYVDTLNELSAEMVEKFYGIAPDKYTSGKVYVGSGGATAEEIACFDAVDEAAAGEIEAACKARVESQIKQFENYVPAELDKLGDPVIVVKGTSVYMCISNNNDKAKEIIG